MDYHSSFPRFKKQFPGQSGYVLLMLPDEKIQSTSLAPTNAMIVYPTR
jgi:hypothetical protein